MVSATAQASGESAWYCPRQVRVITARPLATSCAMDNWPGVVAAGMLAAARAPYCRSSRKDREQREWDEDLAPLAVEGHGQRTVKEREKVEVELDVRVT